MRLLIASVIGASAISGIAAWQIQGWRHGAELAAIQAKTAAQYAESANMILSRERANHARISQSAQDAQTRANRARDSAAAAGDELERLRDASRAYTERIRESDAAAATADLRAATYDRLFGACAANLQDLAERADAHANDVRQLIEAWPK